MKRALILLLLTLPSIALADNCSGFGDCFDTLKLALSTAVGLAIISLILDFIPFVGTGKGIIEAATGRDLITGEKLENWERIIGVIPLVGGVVGGVSDAIRHGDKVAEALRQEGKITEAIKDGSKLEGAGKHGDDIVDAERHGNDILQEVSSTNKVELKEGWNTDDILMKPKGDRPIPNEYLDDLYIASHLDQFNDGGSFLVRREFYDKAEELGRYDGQFIMPKHEMDELLSKTNGEISLIEKELGITPGSWGNSELVRVDVSNPREYNIRIPSGNESGANPNWIPGGKTPGGHSEAVIDPIQKSNSGK